MWELICTSCRIYVIFEHISGNLFQCIGYDYMAYMDYMDPDVLCLKKADKLNHSLTH